MIGVLHITAWYGNVLAPHEAPFIGRHVKALAPFVREQVWHVDVRIGKRHRLITRSITADRTLLLTTTLRRWLLIEWITTALIIWAWLTRDRKKRIDVVNFHIAYPNCTRARLLQAIIRRPFVITEHFSAYRIGFNARSKGVDRIKRIFRRQPPVIVVSRSLQGDIERFIGMPLETAFVIDNAVDTSIFQPKVDEVPQEGRFFAIAGWRSPKRPDVLLDTLALCRAAGKHARIRIAGEGPFMDAMKERIKALGLEKEVDLLGQLSEQQVADEMRKAHALLHASDHETYSAVCAEALCSGTPVVASKVGGIVEYMTDADGVLVGTNEPEKWAHSLVAAWDGLLARNRSDISARMTQRCGYGNVGKAYFDALSASIERHGSRNSQTRT